MGMGEHVSISSLSSVILAVSRVVRECGRGEVYGLFFGVMRGGCGMSACSLGIGFM